MGIMCSRGRYGVRHGRAGRLDCTGAYVGLMRFTFVTVADVAASEEQKRGG